MRNRSPRGGRWRGSSRPRQAVTRRERRDLVSVGRTGVVTPVRRTSSPSTSAASRSRASGSTTPDELGAARRARGRPDRSRARGRRDPVGASASPRSGARATGAARRRPTHVPRVRDAARPGRGEGRAPLPQPRAAPRRSRGRMVHFARAARHRRHGASGPKQVAQLLAGGAREGRRGPLPAEGATTSSRSTASGEKSADEPRRRQIEAAKHAAARPLPLRARHPRGRRARRAASLARAFGDARARCADATRRGARRPRRGRPRDGRRRHGLVRRRRGTRRSSTRLARGGRGPPPGRGAAGGRASRADRRLHGHARDALPRRGEAPGRGRRGARTRSSISARRRLVVAGEAAGRSSRRPTALGVEVVDEAEFLRRAGRGGASPP